MDLFKPLFPADRLHPAFKLLLDPGNAEERALLLSWATGMPDRDRKFVKEFQTTFESSLWELYLHAVLIDLGYVPDFSHASPDFNVVFPSRFVLEATVTRPEVGGKAPVGWSILDIPSDFTEFNNDATLRLCNSIKLKVEKYRSNYARLPHVEGLPFVLAVGAYDRPGSHLAAARPIIAALYGVYHDEQAALEHALQSVPAYQVTGATKRNGSNVPLGLFNNDQYSEVSAVMYSCLATWGKLRALAKNPRYDFLFTSIHPNANSIEPRVVQTPGGAYSENLCDGLYVFHNPYAKHPLPNDLFDHPRIAHARAAVDNNLKFHAADDFLLARFVMTNKRPR